MDWRDQRIRLARQEGENITHLGRPPDAREGGAGGIFDSSRPAFGLGSAKAVNGTKQRCSDFVSIARQNGLVRLRTFSPQCGHAPGGLVMAVI